MKTIVNIQTVIHVGLARKYMERRVEQRAKQVQIKSAKQLYTGYAWITHKSVPG